MSDAIEIRNGRVVTPNTVLEDGRVLLDGSRIARLGSSSDPPSPGTRTVDVGGRLVMPGLIDLHGDDIENQLYPRSNARVDTRTALMAADRENIFNGITTKFHAIAFEDAPSETRSVSSAAELAHEISEADYTLGDNRIHARCELAEESVSAVERLFGELSVDLLSVMHHAPGSGQFDEAGFKQHYVDNKDLAAADAEQLAAERRATSRSDRNGWAECVLELAEEHGIELASHDDEMIADVDRMADLGASISEYPVTLSAVKRANERGLVTTMGAPNLVRGESLCGNLSVKTAIDAATVDVLCADYHPPSMLAAPFVETGESLADRVARVTVNPANAVGLLDRGRIEPGARGDLLVVDPDPIPTVERLFIEGDEVFGRGRQSQPRATPVAKPRLRK